MCRGQCGRLDDGGEDGAELLEEELLHHLQDRGLDGSAPSGRRGGRGHDAGGRAVAEDAVDAQVSRYRRVLYLLRGRS